MITDNTADIKSIWALLESIPDPEIPVISIVDLGIVREVAFNDDLLVISVTPTYSGCPAMRMIEMDIDSRLREEGITNFLIKTIYHPAWTTDWMNDAAKSRLKDYGIAPPQSSHTSQRVFSLLNPEEVNVQCPHCNSLNTVLTSQFGSTACKALYKCQDCLEPFDYFKCI